MTSVPSRVGFSVSGRDVLWERALASLPVALADALRDAELDDPEVLTSFPRGTLQESWVIC